jgi:hypothetical protein
VSRSCSPSRKKCRRGLPTRPRGEHNRVGPSYVSAAAGFSFHKTVFSSLSESLSILNVLNGAELLND